MTDATHARVLDVLETPLTTREVVTALRVRLCDAWAEEQGIELEYNERGVPTDPLYASLLAHGRARDRGEYLNPKQVRNRLLALEREGIVQRIQIPGRRPMLWSQVSS